MKNLKKIIALTVAAASMSISCAHAMDILDPQTKEYNLADLLTPANQFEGWWYWDNDTVGLINSYDVGTEKDTDNNIINDTFDGVTPYIHFAESLDGTPASKFSWSYFGPTLGNPNGYKGNTPDAYTLRYPNVGKQRVEFVFRYNDTDNTTQIGYNVPFALRIPILKTDGTVAFCGLKPSGWDSTHKDFNGLNDGLSSSAVWAGGNFPRAGKFTAGEWNKAIFEVDVVNKKFVVSVYKIVDGQDIFKFSWTDTMPNMYASMRGIQVLFGNSLSFDIGAIKITCDTFAVKDVSITDGADGKLTASMKVGNNADAKTIGHWDNIQPRQHTPYLIVAQYDSAGKLINTDCKNIAYVAPLEQPGAYVYLNPSLTTAPSGNDSLAVTMQDFYKDVTVSIDKADNFAYAKAFVWNSLSDPVPYTASVTEPASIE